MMAFQQVPALSIFAGFLVSLVVGHFTVEWFYRWVHAKLGYEPRPYKHADGKWKRVPPWLTGLIERTLFTVVVAADIDGAAPAMIGWLALRFATHWSSEMYQGERESRHRAYAALMSGALSMLFATLGGLLCRLG